MSLGQLIAFRIISGYVTSPLLRLSGLYQNFQQTLISLERLADIIDTPQESTSIDQLNIPLPRISGAISYEDVSFRFRKSGPLQLSNVSLTISPGQFVAIVGESGSGKSTLTKFTRLYEPASGTISIDSSIFLRLSFIHFAQIGVVPQDSLLFEGSVQDNISLSNPDATSEEIVPPLKLLVRMNLLCLYRMVTTSVGERGSSLSGGQRQRIAIARTVLQNPRLLIMEKPHPHLTIRQNVLFPSI